jgi:hypothetical protein
VKILREIYGLFVDDPWLAAAGLFALALGGVLALVGWHTIAGILEALAIVAGLAVSVRRR